MNTYHDISLNVAVGGGFDPMLETVVRRQVHRILREAMEGTRRFNSREYGFSGAEPKVNLFSSPFLADVFWMEYAKNQAMPIHLIVPSDNLEQKHKEWADQAASIMNLNAGGNHSAGSFSVMSDWIADQADLALLLWDGSEAFGEREIWMLIQACRRNNIPCIWIDVDSPESVYWSMESYYDPYESEKLQKYVSSLFSRDTGVFDPPGKARIPLWKLWDRRYNRFMQKYKAKIQPLPYIVDKVLERDDGREGRAGAGNRNLCRIVDRFHYYDGNAIEYSKKYRTSIYMRSIIPFLAAVFIAFGSFAETVLGFLFRVPDFGMSPWAILASFGFLINGLIFLYIYRLSENAELTSWHPRFIDNRFVAETLRLTAHFAPFGIPVGFSSPLNRFGSKISKNRHVSNELRKIIRSTETESVTFDRALSDKLLKNLTDMVNDQIIYHEYSIARYTAIIKGLKRFIALLFAIGLSVVVGRGCLQFFFFYFDISSFSGNAQLESFIKSLINMFALILPAWASYFSLKLSLSNFEGLLNSSAEMKDYLTVMKKLLADERKRKEISFERIYLFSKELTKLMLGEVAEWYSQISTQKFTKL